MINRSKTQHLCIILASYWAQEGDVAQQVPHGIIRILSVSPPPQKLSNVVAKHCGVDPVHCLESGLGIFPHTLKGIGKWINTKFQDIHGN